MTSGGLVAGLRVLELGRRLGVAAAGLALSALGADVAQVRLPGRRVGDDEAVYYDRGRTVVAPDGALGALAAAADVVLTDLTDPERAALGVTVPGDDDDGRRGDHGTGAAQTVVSILSLGRWGPHAGFRM